MLEGEVQDKKIALLKAQAWNGPWAVLPDVVRMYPTMLTLEELRMLRWLSWKYYSGSGAICDFGCFLGGSTIALSDGLIRSNRQNGIIYSYDLFEIGRKAYNKYLLERKQEFPSNGDSLPIVKSLLGRHAELVSFNKGDVIPSKPPDEEIEICFIDLSKTGKINDFLLEKVFTKFIPGKTIVIQQDYFHPMPPWDVVTMEILDEYFEVVSCTREHSAIFLNTKKIDDAAIEKALSQNFTKALFLKCINKAIGRWPYALHKSYLVRMRKMVEFCDEPYDKAWNYAQPLQKTYQEPLSAEDVF